MAALMDIQLIPKEGKAHKKVTITFPAVTMTVQEFCDFENRIDEVIDFWHQDNFKPEDKRLYATIKEYLDCIEIPEGLHIKYPNLFDLKITVANLIKKQK